MRHQNKQSFSLASSSIQFWLTGDRRTRQEVPKLTVHLLNTTGSTSNRGRHFSILHQVQTGSKYYPAPWTFHSVDKGVET